MKKWKTEEFIRNKQDLKPKITKKTNCFVIISSRDDNNMLKYFRSNNYQFISQLEENVNPINDKKIEFFQSYYFGYIMIIL